MPSLVEAPPSAQAQGQKHNLATNMTAVSFHFEHLHLYPLYDVLDNTNHKFSESLSSVLVCVFLYVIGIVVTRWQRSGIFRYFFKYINIFKNCRKCSQQFVLDWKDPTFHPPSVSVFQMYYGLKVNFEHKNL